MSKKLPDCSRLGGRILAFYLLSSLKLIAVRHLPEKSCQTVQKDYFFSQKTISYPYKKLVYAHF
jgi:hypothetical protein